MQASPRVETELPHGARAPRVSSKDPKALRRLVGPGPSEGPAGQTDSMPAAHRRSRVTAPSTTAMPGAGHGDAGRLPLQLLAAAPAAGRLPLPLRLGAL